jgi:hypothetical protein
MRIAEVVEITDLALETLALALSMELFTPPSPFRGRVF